MIFDQIIMENFGVYRDRQKVILSPPEKNKPIILLGGLNGTGKTTFLDALQLALYGKFARCSSRGKLTYEEFLKRSLNWKNALSQNATLEIKFRHTIDNEENVYKVTRSWGVEKNSVSERVSVELNGQPDNWLTENWYEYIENLLPRRISNLFFFDGEKIESLADENQSAEFLNTAIRSLLGIDLIDRLSTDLVVLQRRKKASTLKVDEDWKLAELQDEIKHIEQQIAEVNAKKENLQDEVEKLQNSLKEVEDQLRLQGGDLLERQKEVENAKNSADEKLRQTENDLADLASGAAPLLLIRNLLNEANIQSKHESRLAETEIVNKTLAKRDAELTILFYSKISDKKIAQELDNWLKTDREERAREDSTNIYLELSKETQSALDILVDSVLDSTRDEISTKLHSFNKLHSLMVDHERNLAAIPAYDSLSDIIAERNQLTYDLIERIAELKSIETQAEKLLKERELKNSRLKELFKKQIEQENEQEDQKLIVQYSEKSRETLKKFRVAVVRHHIEEIEGLILESLNKLLRKKNFISKVKIDPESFLITLSSKDGKVISPERLSAGERQLLAVSILWGLAKASGQTLPAVIDTPMGRLDASHRSYLVERYFPYVSHQVLLLSTDEEISGAYFKELEKHIGHSYSLEYDSSEGITQVKDGYLEEKLHVNRAH